MLSETRLRELLLIVLLNLAALGGLTWRMRDVRGGAVRIEPPPTAVPTARPTPARLRVHVSGAVASPGLVALPEGARVDDAIRAAGGLAPEAEPERVNLAAPLADGAQLHVPRRDEPGPEPAAGVTGGAGIGGGAALPEPGGAAPAPAGGAGAGATVDVNRAGAAELESLPGIGPALAARILAHREAKGPFQAVEDLLAVSGIGERTLERLRPSIAVR